MTRQVFDLPDLGEGLAEAELIRWLVAVGDVVPVDHPVAEVETAKATVEVPTPYAGIVAELHGQPGQALQVGKPLVSVDPVQLGATAAPLATRADSGMASGAAQAYVHEERAGSGNVLIGYGTSQDAAPGRGRRGRRRAADGPAIRLGQEVPVAQAATGNPAVRSPLVRQLAKQRGVDVRRLPGSGPGGLVTRADVERASESAPDAASLPAGAPLAAAEPAATSQGALAGVGTPDTRTGLPIGAEVPLRGPRKAIATTLTRSRREVPDATTWVDVDATELMAWRASMSTATRPAPGLLALVARFTVAGLRLYPELNSRVDPQAERILHLDGVNLGIAAETARGLLVPAVRNAHLLSARGLDAEIRRLVGAARSGEATAADLSSGSFTLNNYGMLGVDGSAAIINHPEVAMLGMGRVLPRPWVVNGQIVVRQIVQLSLVFDHRVCDGGTAGGFLRFVADAIEAPAEALAEL